MKSIDEICEVMQASKTKEIESCVSGENKWVICRQPLWNWGCIDYRVKVREPRKIWIAHYNEKAFVLDVPDSTLSNAAEYIELTPEVKTKLGMT